MTKDVPVLLDHAARLLERTPARCMSAGSLHERACRDTGLVMPLPRLLHALATRPDRFALIHTHPAAGNFAGWTQPDLAAYGRGSDAGSEFLVMLAQPPAADPFGGDGAAEDGAGRWAHAALLADVHDALVRVLDAAAGDEALYRAAGAAAQDLAAVQLSLRAAG